MADDHSPQPFIDELKQQCMWCDNIAIFACDTVLGMSAAIAPGPRIVYAPIEQLEVYTCDALMCLLHRHVCGFFCGKEPGTIDRCPYCARNEPRGGPMTQDDAERVRRERHAEIRRARMRA